jgi:DNA-binding NtrC family response regulator
MKKTQANILIVDDQDEVLIAVKMTLKRHFEQVITLNNPNKILSTIAEHDVQIVLLDMNFRMGYEDGKEGIYRLKEIQEHYPNVRVIFMTSYAQLERAVEGIKLGAIDYLLKPWDNEKLVETIKQTLQLVRKLKITPVVKETKFIGQAKSVTDVYQMAARVAKTDANILILGENGTGKFVLAEYIHKNSLRHDKPFIHVDLGSLNENLFESELFGYPKGAFTDARQDTAGRFEVADGGTIFLDEIGNIPAHLQSKLLQVIQNRKVVRLGESKPRDLDVRIITATNAHLKKMVDEKVFREDLYYRINTITLEIPALRNRIEDLPDMIRYFIDLYADKYQLVAPALELADLEKLKQYAWPGNIRELQNRVERGIILANTDRISFADFGLNDFDLINTAHSENTLSDLEKNRIITSLLKFNNNVSKSAEDLGLTRQALYRKLEKYQINIK